MINLHELLHELKRDNAQLAAHHSLTQSITGFELDSRRVQAGNVFIALRSFRQDSAMMRQYIEQALTQGAVAVLSELPPQQLQFTDPRIVYIADIRHRMGSLQQQFLQAQQPQSLARVAAVTGTNGKTTIVRLIAELLTLLGQKAAITGTTGNGILPQLSPSSHTTLDALQFQQLYYDMSAQGAAFMAIEASSHGLEQGRLAGTPIEVAAFSNVSRDHLDYHHTMRDYAAAKARLFAMPSLKHAVINSQDDYAHVMLKAAQDNPQQPQIWCYRTGEEHSNPMAHQAQYWITDLNLSLTGAEFTLNSPHGCFKVSSPLLGRFNVDNVLAAMITVEKLGFDLTDIVALVARLQGAPGRMQAFQDGKRLFLVDYAHTPDALQQVLQSVRHHLTGRLWVVFGCGGDRDRGKRPLMTQAALQHADHVIVTADNPRSEPLAQIFADMLNGIADDKAHLQQIEDRRLAIKTAVAQASAGDIVVIAGKGHENYQEIDGVRHWFDDAVEVAQAIATQHSQPQAYPAD